MHVVQIINIPLSVRCILVWFLLQSEMTATASKLCSLLCTWRGSVCLLCIFSLGKSVFGCAVCCPYLQMRGVKQVKQPC